MTRPGQDDEGHGCNRYGLGGAAGGRLSRSSPIFAPVSAFGSIERALELGLAAGHVTGLDQRPAERGRHVGGLREQRLRLLQDRPSARRRRACPRPARAPRAASVPARKS